jgi:hypothetical protein
MSAMANVEVNLASIDDAEFCKAKREVMLPAIGSMGESWRGLAGDFGFDFMEHEKFWKCSNRKVFVRSYFRL